MKLILLFLASLSYFNTNAALPPDIFRSGDDAFKNRGLEGNDRKALSTYRTLFEKNPKSPEAAWKLAMACEFVGYRLTPDDEGKEALFKEGKAAGELGIQLDPKCAPCHFWTAVNEALYGQTVGVFKMIFSLNGVQEHLKTSISIDPNYASGGAYRILGLIDQKLPGILGGDDSRARDYFRKAIEVAPDDPMNYLALARILEESFHSSTEALAVARRGSQVSLPVFERLESRESLDEIKALQAKLEAKVSQ